MNNTCDVSLVKRVKNCDLQVAESSWEIERVVRAGIPQVNNNGKMTAGCSETNSEKWSFREPKMRSASRVPFLWKMALSSDTMGRDL